MAQFHFVDWRRKRRRGDLRHTHSSLRFLAHVHLSSADDTAVAGWERGGRSVAPEIRYAKSGDVHIAYQVFGHGPENLIIIPGFISHVEHSWDSPDQVRWLEPSGETSASCHIR